MGVIVFNGVSSASQGIYIWSSPDYDVPEKDQEVYHVPGRSGDLIVDYGSWKNAQRTYTVTLGNQDTPNPSGNNWVPASQSESFPVLARKLTNWINSAHAVGYARLEDSYDQGVYRMAYFKGGLQITNVFDVAAMATITFECKPQRFLLSGESQQTVSSGSTIANNTLYDSNPKFLVRGSGSGTIKCWRPADTKDDAHVLYRVDMTDLTDSDLVIDGEMQECYRGTASKNSTVTLSNGFPKLLSGGLYVTFTGVSSLKVVPNTWLL